MPTQAEIEQHQQDIQELSALAAAQVAAVVMAASGEDDPSSTLLEAIPEVWRRFMSFAADLAVEWYRGMTRAEPVAAVPERGGVPPIVGPTGRIQLLDAAEFEPLPAEPPPREQLEATVRWALYRPAPGQPDEAPADEPEPEGDEPDEPDEDIPELEDQPEPEDRPEPEDEPDGEGADEKEDLRARVIPADATDEQARVISRLTGATQRYVTSAARNTVTENADAEGVRWARHAKPDACTFCRLLATRGPDYLTEESATRVGTSRIRGPRKKGEEYHDDCECEPVAVRAGDSYQPPEYVDRWFEQYEEAHNRYGNQYKKILAAMRAAEKSHSGSAHSH